MTIPNNSTNTEINKVSNRFMLFAKNECHASSPLYEFLSLNVANDIELLEMVVHVNYHQPLPNILFGTVHYLLLKHIDHPLADFYPTIRNSSTKEISETTYALFRNFCFDYKTEIYALISSRIVQTNEVLRSTCLFPGFSYIDFLTNHNPLALIEIGSSAGFNLHWDKYCYDYGSNDRYGDLQSPLVLQCTFKNDKMPNLANIKPSVGLRIGIDLKPVNILNEDDVFWLKALIWPEHLDRFERLTKIVDILKEDPPTILTGDAIQILPDIFTKVPMSLSLVIFHSFTFYQLSRTQREEFITLVLNESKKRECFVLSLESLREGNAKLQLDSYANGNKESIDLAYCHSHGRWMEWLT